MADEFAARFLATRRGVETAPGQIFTIYYMTNDDGITHVAGTHWTVPAT